MNFRYLPQEEQFRQEVQQFIKENLTPEARAENYRGSVRGRRAQEFLRQLAAAGLLGLSWPREYGGKELPPLYDFILDEELAYAHAPIPTRGIGIVGRTLMRHGSDWQKREFLPKILKHEIEIALGYSEPEAGSDLASIQLRAVEDGDDYVLNGQKLFCSAADISDWVWLMARTAPDLPRHRGISMFIVDLRRPGITVRALKCMDSDKTCEVFFDDVRVPKKYLVGEPNKGFYYAMEALSFERHVTFPTSLTQALLDSLLDWVRRSTIDDIESAKDPLVRHKLARLAIEMEVFRALGLRVVAAVQKGLAGDTEAAMHKLFGSHLEQRLANTALDIMGPYGQLKQGSKYAQAEGKFEHAFRQSILLTIGGGTSEIQKNIIAERYLGLPR